jgi:hypothetical protein
MDRRMGGAKSRYGRCGKEKILAVPGIEAGGSILKLLLNRECVKWIHLACDENRFLTKTITKSRVPYKAGNLLGR